MLVDDDHAGRLGVASLQYLFAKAAKRFRITLSTEHKVQDAKV